ncbi:reverse gyrase [Ignicoccus islandicus]|uniref:reverse gyrase n=1 Tax=Ignicoccus islandicus TaxID=54259 RepID=UPI001F00C8DB|nr:reverse gyrase [Ignicoccus islandicus]
MIYREACPSCGGDIERSRLTYGLSCGYCDGKSGLFEWMRKLEEEYERFSEYLKSEYGIEPSEVQKTWIKLLLSGEDVVISAPTGMGKSTILGAYAQYVKRKGLKVLYIVPTRSLITQVANRVSGIEVVTSAKVIKNPSAYKGYDVIIVDDVDAALKSEKTVAALMKIAGLDDVYEEARRAAKLLIEAMNGNEQALEEYVSLKAKLSKYKRKSSQLIFSSATHGRPSLIARLMLSALGIRPVFIPPLLREIDDVKLKVESLEKQLPSLIRKLMETGYGGIVFVHEGGPKDEILRILKENDIKAKEVGSRSIKAIKEFEKGEIDVLVASASRYGVVARGIDMPDRLRFAIFIEPPHKKLELRKMLSNPLFMLRILKKLGLEQEFLELGKKVKKLSKIELNLLRENLSGNDVKLRSERLKELSEFMRELIKKVERELSNTKIIDPPFIIKNGSVIILDKSTYLQASGRTSRLTFKGFTKGVSVILYSDEDVMEAFEKLLSDITTFESEVKPPEGYKEVDAESVLMIVESPTKARTIARIFGGGSSVNLFGSKVYTTAVKLDDKVYFLYITASKGHLFDLTLDDIGLHGVMIEGNELIPVYSPIKRCLECGYAWSGSLNVCPRCGSTKIDNSIERVNSLRKLAYVVNTVILATDPDEEGEKIAWDLEAMLKPFNKNVRRATYFEVTKRGIEESLKNLKHVDESVVRSQIVRRVDDRIVGFEVSKELWSIFSRKNIGLGRVQGPVLNYIVERNEKWKENRGFVITLVLENNDVIRVFSASKEEMERLLSLKEVEIISKVESIDEIPPPPPLTTDELLAEAAKMGLEPNKVMKISQTLFEMGLITYHRTDSTRISSHGISLAKEIILREYGESRFHPRSWSSEGAHEAIRPTHALTPRELLSLIYVNESYSRLTADHVKVYEIIFRRFVASQMKNVKVRKLRVTYRVNNSVIQREYVTEVVEDGWNLVLDLPVFTGEMRLGKVKVVNARALRASKFPLPSASEVIKWMREVGIGRPSTYARTLEALRRHGLVVFSKYKKLLVATRDGYRVKEVMGMHFPELLSAEYTKHLQELMERAPEEFEEVISMIAGKSKFIREAFASEQS